MGLKIISVVFTLIGGFLITSGMYAHLEFIGKLGISHDVQAVTGLILAVLGFCAHLLSGGELLP
ncbi:hypothetical protein [Burkholderia contaminans]|uniref:hypothetical protein n=1 Tax=Burkholderia contaminans TaxID=488447 RepID=UPI002417EF5E|nr:hypothetical protein [Burkholderia contaminans]WFN15777.1 hypothetical protein LXE92_40765 [Burkholderia contaminans]